MYKVNEAFLEVISRVEGKGEPVVSAGTTGSGKSAANEACASHPVPQSLLALREASGKGSTSETSVIATDYEAIPEDKLIMIASLKPKTEGDCGDDNAFLGNVVYSAAKDYAKNPDEAVYRAKLSKALSNAIQHPANESLAYKIRGIGNEDTSRLMEILLKFPVDEVMIIFNEMMAKNLKKGQKGVRIFIELLSARESFKEIINGFWQFVVEFINRDIESLKGELEASGAHIEKNQSGYKFVAILGEEDIDSPITEVLLKSEDGSKEYLLSDISLIFRGADYIFDVPNKDLLTVSEIGGTKIHCVHIIDTQGLFHATGVDTKDEAERMITLLTTYHSNRLMLVVNSFVNDTVKDGYEAIYTMLQEANRDIEIYVLFTHWDEYLKSLGNQGAAVSRFSRSRGNIDWSEKYAEAEARQQVVTQRFKEAIASNTSKRKPEIVGVYRAAILSDSESKMEDVLDERGIDYPNALNSLFSDMAKRGALTGQKFRVLEGVEECVHMDTSKFGNQNISALYDNLVVDCKNLKLYASTVRACTRKWSEAGAIHRSNVVANDYGFQNITTSFVQEIRNYSMLYVKKMEFDVKAFLPNQEEEEVFVNALMNYLASNQNVGREVAKLIGQEAYKKGFDKDSCFKYQYQRFTDMLQYTQDNYFVAKTIPFTVEFEKCLMKATKECIRNFVDAKCVVVF